MESRSRDGKRAGAPERTYSVGEFASLTGVTVRTLYHYESLGLLHPRRLPNGYRQYGRADVDRMQQILILRELGWGSRTSRGTWTCRRHSGARRSGTTLSSSGASGIAWTE